MESANVRNLEQIQEQETVRRGGRFGALLLASGAGAALVVAGVMVAGRDGPATRSLDDPLADLVRSAKAAELGPEKLRRGDVSFPGLLSDEEHPTTALAAVKDERGRLVDPDALPSAATRALSTAPPPATDRLPVVPLPAGNLLSATPVTTQPKDALAQLAADVSNVDEAVVPADPGSEGGYQIQVASFKEQADADAFVEQLRRRGHGAFRQTAQVAGRGQWHRVRVGPFKNKYQAQLYKNKFEKSERVSPFIVDPGKVEQSEQIRAAKLAARVEKYGRP